MKRLKLLFLAVLSLAVVSCSSSEDNSTTPLDIEVTGDLDLQAFNNLLGLDATALVTFSGEAASTYTAETIPGDALDFTINTSSSTTEIRIIDFRYNFSGGNTTEDDWFSNFEVSIDTLSSPAKAIIQVNSDAAIDEDAIYKFDIDFKVYENGVTNNNVYFVDPKIRIKRKR